jgi:hypothetical protein
VGLTRAESAQISCTRRSDLGQERACGLRQEERVAEDMQEISFSRAAWPRLLSLL